MEVSGLLHLPAALPLKEEFPVSTGQETGGLQSRPGRGDEDKFFSSREPNLDTRPSIYVGLCKPYG
jgi:hypothetical protein